MKGTFLAAAALALLTCVAAGRTRGQEAAPPLQFRRIFVPEEALDGQIRGLLPLKREEFDKRLQLIGELRENSGPAQVRIQRAAFRARYDQGQLVDGAATLEVMLDAPGPAVLPLSPCSIAIQSARWAGEEGHPATIGIDPSGKLVCLVERSGKLELSWSQQGRATVDGAASFELSLPSAPQCRLEIEVPSEYRLASESGLPSVGHAPAESDYTQLRSFELGGSSQARLTVRRDEPAAENKSLVVVRESATYSILAAAVDLETTLTLDVLDRPLAGLVLLADPALKITSIRMADRELAWSSQPGADETDLQQHEVALESPVQGIARTIQITATADWPDQRRWTLPRIRALGASWQEGRATIAAPAWLRLDVQPLAGCERTAVATADAGRSEDQFHFQLFAEDAAIEIAADPRTAPLRERSGTEIRIDASQVSGVMTAELSSLGGERFAIDAVLPRHWLIDSVETLPADMLADRSTAPRGPGQQALRVNLTRSLTEGRPLKLIIRGHYRRPAAQEPLTAEFFRLASFPQAREQRRLTCVRVSDPATELKLSGDEQLARLAPADLSPADLQLFETPPSGLLFEAGEGVDSVQGQLAPTAPRYLADVLVQAHADREHLRQTVSIRCQPQASAVQTLLVRIAPRPPGGVTWRLVGEDARELTDAPVAQAGAIAGDEAVYRLTLARPRASPFEVRGELAAAQDAHGGYDVSLASLPEAASQTGLVEVFSQEGGRYSVIGSDIERLPAPAIGHDRYSPLVARFRYEAGRRAGVRVVAAQAASQPAAWIESLHLSSRFSVAGEGDHEVALSLVNSGLQDLRLRLPAHIANLRLSDESAGSLTRTTAGGAVIALPQGLRRADIRLSYSTSGSAIGVFPLGHLAAPLPQFNVPVFSQTWEVALAPGIAALSQPLARSSAASDPDSTWAGWSHYRPTWNASGEARITIYRAGMFQVWSVCLGMAAAALVLASRGRASKWLPLAGLCGAASLVVAAPWSWLALAAALGVAGASLATLLRPREHVRGAAEPAAIGSTIVLAAGQGSGALLLALLLLQADRVSAQPAASPKYWRVVIPVDEDRQPVGDYVFLEPEFYESLHKLGAAGTTGLPAWLLESARYEVSAAPASDEAASVQELRMQLDFQTFRPDAEVALPFRRDQVSLVEGRARLDGNSLALDWAEGGGALKFTAPAAGRHRLELTLAAPAGRDATGRQLDLAIPAAAQASLSLPAGPAEVYVAGEAHPLQHAGGAQIISLGASDRLKIRWPNAAPDAAGTAEMEQLLSWRVRPGSVILDGRFVLRPGSTPVRELLLAVDPRLRLVSPVGGASGGPISRVVPLEGSSNLVRAELAEPASREVELKLSWLWMDARGVGTLLLPTVAVRDHRVRRSWLGVTVEPGFTAQWDSPPAAAPALTAIDFLAAFGESAVPPALVRDATLQAQPAIVRIVPQQREPHAEQNDIDWSLSSHSAAARLSLKLTHVPPSRLSHRLSLPPQLEVQTVELEQTGRSAQIRWSQQADGLLTIQLLEAPASEQELTIAAELPVAPDRQRMQLPAARLLHATMGASRMRIFRREDVQLTLLDPAGWTRQDEAQLGQHVPGLGRLVAALASGSSIGDTQPRLSRSANRPRLGGSMLIRVEEDDGDWRAETRLDLEVAGGVLDEMWLSIPAEWSGPFSIQPSGNGELTNLPEHQVVPIPGDSRRHLLIRPLKAAKDRLQLTISGPLASGASGIEAPDVHLLTDAPTGDAALQRLVLLDTRAGTEEIDWETTGLLAIPEDQAQPADWRAAGGHALRVVAPRFSAKARIRASAVTAPRVLLADTDVRLNADRRAALTSIFTIDPNGAADATFTLPPGWRLVQAQVDGVLADAQPAGLRSWRMAAPGTSLPYRLTIVADGWLPADAAREGRFALAAPELNGMTIEHAAWVVAGGPYRASAAGGQALRGGAAADLALLRMEAAAAGLSAVADAVANELPAAVQSESFRAWWVDYSAAAGRLAALPAAAKLTERRDAAQQAAERARQRMLAGGLLQEGDLPRATAVMAPSASMAAESHFVADGEGHAITLVAASPTPAGMPQLSAIWAAAIAALSFVLLFVLPQPEVRDWLAAHGGLLLAAAGIVWWLAAPWGAAGWVLVAAAIWLSLRWTWPRGGYEPSAASW